MNGHAASAGHLCCSVCQFLIYSTFILVSTISAVIKCLPCCRHFRTRIVKCCQRAAAYHMHVVREWSALDWNKCRVHTYHISTTSGRHASGSRPTDRFVPCPVRRGSFSRCRPVPYGSNWHGCRKISRFNTDTSEGGSSTTTEEW